MEFEWLVGTWEGKDGNGVFQESWDYIGETDDLIGNGYVFVGDDTVFREMLFITRKDDSWQYQAQVATQNEGETISFPCTVLSEGKALFENPDHDFPRTIDYQLDVNGVLRIELTGVEEGSARTSVLELEKVE